MRYPAIALTAGALAACTGLDDPELDVADEALSANWSTYPRFRFSVETVDRELVGALGTQFDFPSRFDADVVIAFADTDHDGVVDVPAPYFRDPGVTFPISHLGLLGHSGSRIGSPFMITDPVTSGPGFCGDVLVYGEKWPALGSGLTTRYFVWIALRSTTFVAPPGCTNDAVDYGIGSYDPQTHAGQHATFVGGGMIALAFSGFRTDGRSGTQLPSPVLSTSFNSATPRLRSVGSIDMMQAGELLGPGGLESRRVTMRNIQFSMPFLDETAWSGSWLSFAPTAMYLDGAYPSGSALTATGPDTVTFDARTGDLALALPATLPHASSYRTLRFADVTGDGRADACYLRANDVACHAARADHTFGAAVAWSADFGFNDLPAENQWATVQLADLDGDGRADICARAAAGVRCARSTGAAFGPSALWDTTFSDGNGWTAPEYWKTVRFPDVDGDGRADLCGRAAGGISCAISDGTGFWAMTPSAAGAFTNALHWNASPSYYETIQYADLDGDGRADVCGRASDGIYCARSLGFGFEAARRWHDNFRDSYGWNAEAYWRTITLADVNRDGTADLCGRGSAGMLCTPSLGGSFAPGLSTASAAFSDAGGWSAPRYYRTIHAVDIDGDGAADLCGSGHAGIWCARATPDPYTRATLFAPAALYFNALGDAALPAEANWSTLAGAGVDGDAAAELCAYTTRGLECTY